jgi:hypothetical protein
MRVSTRGLSVWFCLLLAGCSAFDKGRLDPKVASQVVVSKLDPPPGCDYLGGVKGTAPLGELGEAHGDVLRNAVLRGGNYVAVDLVERPVVLGLGSYVVRGRLFSCPSNAAPIAQAPAAPLAPAPIAPAAPLAGAPAADPTSVRACDPECASGFTCQLGACVAVPAPHAAGPAN